MNHRFDMPLASFKGACKRHPGAQPMPSMQAFTAGPEWREVRIPLSSFAGADVATLRAVAITAGQPEGTFELYIDQVELR